MKNRIDFSKLHGKKVAAVLGIGSLVLLRFLATSPSTTGESPSVASDSQVATTPQTPGERALASVPYPSFLKVNGHAVPVPFQAELSQFQQLKQKVFPTLEEEQQRQSLLTNRDILLGMRELLVSPDLNLAGLQDAALDMLFEAFQSGDSKTAAEVFQAVVMDKKIEDSGLEMNLREHLAGIKAEVLFQWTAIDAKASDKIGMLLPGPISEKIWQNVLESQETNLAESRAEAGDRFDDDF